MAYLEITNLRPKKIVFDTVFGVVEGFETKRREVTVADVEKLSSSLKTLKDNGIISFDYRVGGFDNVDDTEFVSHKDVITMITDAVSGIVVSGSSMTIDAPLTGVINGVNTVFTSAIKWVRTASSKELLYLNGQRLKEGPGNDYVASESTLGSGYDTITMSYAPRSGDSLQIDFYEL